MDAATLARFRALALRLISKYGTDVQWVSVTQDAPLDPEKPWIQGRSEIQIPVKIAFLPIELIDKEFRRYDKNIKAIKGSEAGLMPSVSFTPTMIDYVLDGSEKKILANFTPFKPDGNVIFYIVEFEL